MLLGGRREERKAHQTARQKKEEERKETRKRNLTFSSIKIYCECQGCVFICENSITIGTSITSAKGSS